MRSLSSPIRRAPRPALAATALAVALAACGGSAPQPTPGGGQATQQPAGATAGAGTAPAATSPGSGPKLETADDFCLISTQDVGAQLDVEVATATGTANPGLGGACVYTDAAGAGVLTYSVLTGSQAAAAFDTYASSEGSEPVSGVGDRAIYLPLLGELLGIAFIKGGVVVSMAPAPDLPIYDDETALRAALLELGRLAAERL